MSKPKKKASTQSVEDMVEIQKHTMDPGYYVGTGRVQPHVSAPGNPKPLGVLYICGAVLFFALGLILLFSDVRVSSSGLIESDLANKIIMVMIFCAIALFCLIMGLAYFRRAKRRTKKAHSAKRRK